MDDIKNKIIIVVVIITCALLINNQKRRYWWVKPWLQQKKFNLCIVDEFLRCKVGKAVKNFLRMDKKTFNKLLNKVKHRFAKMDTKLRNCISSEERLIITLRYLATGESYRSLMYNFRVSESAISRFVPEVCKAIFEELKVDYLRVPNTTAEWLEISREFEEQWNLPNVIGAIDGKHVAIKAPCNQGSIYYNYKGVIVLYCLEWWSQIFNFIYINVGVNGRISDGGVYRESDLRTCIEQNTLYLPKDKPLPHREKPIPYVIVADAAFPLSTHILKPYPFRNMTRHQRIFNYRLSRARRVIENTFGILANRFRILINPIPLHPQKVKIIVQACCALHNFLRWELHNEYTGNNPAIENDRRYRFLYGLSKQAGNRSKNEAMLIRDEFKEYVNGPRAVPWQDDLA